MYPNSCPVSVCASTHCTYPQKYVSYLLS